MPVHESTFEDATMTSPLPRRYQASGESGGVEGDPSHANVGRAERQISVAAGAIAAVAGLVRRDKLGLLLAGVGAGMLYRGISGNCPGYRLMGIDTNTEDADAAQARLESRGVDVSHAFTINRPLEDLYKYWRDFTNLPRIMTHLEAVRVLDERRSHWVAKGAAGREVEWDAEITEDVPNEKIAWRSLPGADVDNAGAVRFEMSPRGTVVRVAMRYVAPAGAVGRWIATLLGQSPDRQIREDLRNFKRIMETGELPTILGQSNGSCTGQGRPYSENNSYLAAPNYADAPPNG